MGRLKVFCISSRVSSLIVSAVFILCTLIHPSAICRASPCGMPAFSSHLVNASMLMTSFLNVLSLFRLSGCSVCVSGVCGLVPVSCAVFAEFFGILRSFSAVCGLCLRSADSAVFGVTAQRFVGVDPTLKLISSYHMGNFLITQRPKPSVIY